MSKFILKTWDACPICGSQLSNWDPRKRERLDELAEDFNRAALRLRGPARMARKMLHVAILLGIGLCFTLILLAVLL